jgi:hypothetical protein
MNIHMYIEVLLGNIHVFYHKFNNATFLSRHGNYESSKKQRRAQRKENVTVTTSCLFLFAFLHHH